MSVLRRVRALLYDFAIVPLTAGWYRAVLTRLPPRCRLLDVGIGTGSALFANADLIVAKEIQVVGIDVNAAYVESCRRGAARHGLDTRVVAQLESVYDHRGGPYDAAYFSGSFMLLPDPPGALRHVGSLLAPGGCIYFTQTFEHRRSRVVETCKPLLRFLTTIDFGRVTYEHEFRRALEQGNTDLEAVHTLRASRRRSSVLVVARAAAG